MSGRVSIVMSVYNHLALTRACLATLAATTERFSLIVIDNGSTDGTREFFDAYRPPFPFRFERNPVNMSVLATYNRGWRLADTEYVCFLHNDTEMTDPAWLSRLIAVLGEPGAGLAGLYGIKRLRRTGRYVGRTIVHSLAEGPTVRRPWEEVCVVDGVCLCLPRNLMQAIGGFDEAYGFYHGFDRDLSFSVRERGRRCFVVYAPFIHRGGGTRTSDFAVSREREREDQALRARVMDRFLDKYGHRLPCDVRPLSNRVGDWVRAKVLRA